MRTIVKQSTRSAARLRFVERLQGFDAEGQRRLLDIESDVELDRIKATAVQAQYFEVAVACSLEQKRRTREVNVTL